MLKLRHLLLDRAQVGEHRHAFIEDGAAFKTKPILRQIAEGRVPGGDDRAVVERLEAGENFQQRGFTGAIRADQSDAGVRSDEPVKIFEEKFGAEAFTGGGELDHRWW